jgi:hypothetical protein
MVFYCTYINCAVKVKFSRFFFLTIFCCLSVYFPVNFVGKQNERCIRLHIPKAMQRIVFCSLYYIYYL